MSDDKSKKAADESSSSSDKEDVKTTISHPQIDELQEDQANQPNLLQGIWEHRNLRNQEQEQYTR